MTGREPTQLRPPYGHLGSAALLAAAELGYDVTLWSHETASPENLHSPQRRVTDFVDSVLPGTILLACDTCARDRLAALQQLRDIVSGLRVKGYEFTTVSKLAAAN